MVRGYGDSMPDSDPDEPRDRLELSAAQVAASSLAAVSAAVLCSYFGVAGTVIGTAAASIVATVGSSLYSYSLRRTRNRLRRLHQAGAAAPPVTAVLATARLQGRRLLPKLPWKVVLLGTANVFVFSIAVVTGIEGLVGEPLSAAYGGGHSQQKCSICAHHRHAAKPSPSKSASPSPSGPASKPAGPGRSPTPTSTLPVVSNSPSATPTTPAATPTTTPTGIASP
jgi:hypothetical protein